MQRIACVDVSSSGKVVIFAAIYCPEDRCTCYNNMYPKAPVCPYFDGLSTKAGEPPMIDCNHPSDAED